MKTEIPTNMHATISQTLYPNRRAFFEKLALSLPFRRSELVQHLFRVQVKAPSGWRRTCAGSVTWNVARLESRRLQFLDEIIDSIARWSGRKEFLQRYL